MNNYIILVICAFIHFTGCQRVEKESFPKYLATIENRTISNEKVDSVISGQIYQLRKSTLKTLLRSTIIEIQAQKQNLTKEALLKEKLGNNNNVSTEQYYKYLLEQSIDSKNTDTTKIVEYLLGVNKQKHFEYFTDSLLAESNISINLKPEHYAKVKLDELDYNELTIGRELIVLV